MRKMEGEERKGNNNNNNHNNNNNNNNLDRVMFKKAMSISSSFACQICVVGFICGVCLTSLFLAGLTSFFRFDFDGIQVHHLSAAVQPWNSVTPTTPQYTDEDGGLSLKVVKKDVDPNERRCCDKEKVSALYSAWSVFLNETQNPSTTSRMSVPKAPHFEDCEARANMNKRLDTRVGNETFPPWTLWKGSLDVYSAKTKDTELHEFRHKHISDGSYPPWITGADDENYPLTRKVQRDLWLYQHPKDCYDPKLKFLMADFETLPGLGVGAQIAAMCAVLSLALAEERILVINYYNRADHDGCKGSSRGSWSCYFLPETSQECRNRAVDLMGEKEAWKNGTIKSRREFTSRDIWTAETPKNWGTPWSYMQPTTEINGTFFAFHRDMDRRWWLAQVVRYLMRFPTETTCQLMNQARHSAFGKEAAEMVLASNKGEWPQEDEDSPPSDIEQYVWWNRKPWIPRPLLSVHVRMGDKACEMQVVTFDGYMKLADRVRKQFPELKNIWISTEMEEVINMTKQYVPEGWNFYYTDIKRQVGNISMAKYEASLGRRRGTENSVVNFMMATQSDYFIGALGSTWCHLIDGMRNTGGKVMAGYLSVNKDRHW